jgi:hypothetical protein
MPIGRLASDLSREHPSVRRLGLDVPKKAHKRAKKPADLRLKEPSNLYLDPGVIERAEAYGRQRGVNLSSLVSEYLEALTRRSEGSSHGPLVRRLLGAGVPRATKSRGQRKPGIQDYRSHLDEKYGHK